MTAALTVGNTSTANRWRKKPVTISAFQWTGSNVDAVMDFIRDNQTIINPETRVTLDMTGQPPLRLLVHTLESTSEPLVASDNDWIIIGVKGEVYPCKPDIFEQTYDRVEEGKQR